MDDAQNLINAVKFVLETQGYEVIVALDGKECLNKLEKEKPDAVLLDIMMPKMGGLEVLKKIKEKYRDLPVAMLTVRNQDIDKMLALHVLKADDYITKPYKGKELVERVQRLLSSPLELEVYRLKNEVSLLAEVNERLEEGIKQLQRKKGIMTGKDADMYGAICGSVAHSLKSEFLHIGNSIKVLRELSGTSIDVQEECDMVERSAEYSRLLLQRLLDYFDIGKPPEELVDVHELLRRTEFLAMPRLPSRIQLRITVDQGMKERMVSANIEQLMGVLLELIRNAANVLRERGGTIELRVEGKDGKIAISVKDDGPGIPVELRKDLFKKQVPSKSGLGLGLFLSNKVVSALGGKLNLQTSSEKGTIFTIVLPTATGKKDD